MTGRTFVARYATRCPACQQAIVPGMTARWNDEEQVEHADCDQPTTVGRDRPACPVCWLTSCDGHPA